MIVLFTAWGYEVTLLELLASIAAFAAIALGIKGTRWTWPMYLVSSVLYGIVFWQYDLYASAALQLVFIAAAVWGWFDWGPEGAQPRVLAARSRLIIGVGAVAAWIILAPALKAIGGAATWADAFVLVGSVVAQVLMVTSYAEAWVLWIVVDLVGTVHYARQGLWFTAILYAALVVMAVIGWRSWRARSHDHVVGAAEPTAVAGA